MDSKHGSAASKITAASLLVALGIIYGDIGTSPLYVLKAVVGPRPISELLIYGGISCVFWTLTFQTTFKYIYLTLQADNHGEGGIFSLYGLVKRYGKFLVIPTIIGASTLLADGIITPPISVASAVEGLTNIKGLEHIPTVPIVIFIISVLFFFQRYGTHKVGAAFGPAMLVWFFMLLILGISQVVQNPAILQAISPVYAYRLLAEYPMGFLLLGAVFLATTGAEALYSDLGHCGRGNIRITWVFVKICLLVNYMGQAAWLLSLGENSLLDGRNPFFEIMPSWFLLPGIIIATFAAVIASQALISGSYTLINEAMNMGFWPRLAIKQPSDIKGQIYIPSVNMMLWIGCVFIVLYFKESSHMEAAYGLAITLTMMVTTYLLTFFLWYKLNWNRILVTLILLLFVTIELAFFFANIQKFPEGGYITLLISSIYVLIMYSVYSGKKISSRFTEFTNLNDHTADLRKLSEDDGIPKFATHLVYLTKSNSKSQIEQRIIKSIFGSHPKRADVYWFVNIVRTNEPYSLSYDVAELVDDLVIRVNINVGFRIPTKTEVYFKDIVTELINSTDLKLNIRPTSEEKYHKDPVFKFVVIEKFLSVENEFTLRDGILLNTYFFLKRIGQSSEIALGLDKDDVVLEKVPFLIQPGVKIPMTRGKVERLFEK